MTQDNITVIPISKVGFGFAAGGSEFNGQAIKEYNKNKEGEEIAYRTPFGGGSGAGVSIKPVAFLVIQDNIVKILPVEHSCTIDKILDYVPDLMEKANKMLDKVLDKENKREIKVVKPKTTKADIVYKFDYNSKDKDEKADDDEYAKKFKPKKNKKDHCNNTCVCDGLSICAEYCNCSKYECCNR